MNSSDFNLILANLEEAAIHRGSEITLASLLDKKSFKEFSLDGQLRYINNAYPKCRYACVRLLRRSSRCQLCKEITKLDRCKTEMVRWHVTRSTRRCNHKALEGFSHCKQHRPCREVN